MNIAHIILNLEAGGAQTLMVNLAIQQKTTGNSVSIIIVDKFTNSSFENSLKIQLRKNYIEFYTLNRKLGKNLSLFRSYLILHRLFKKLKPEIVNSHLSLTHLVLALILRVSPYKNKPKHIITLHNAPEDWSRINLKINSKTSSIYCSEAALTTCEVRNCPKIVIPNGINRPVVDSNDKHILKDFEIKKENKIVLCV